MLLKTGVAMVFLALAVAVGAVAVVNLRSGEAVGAAMPVDLQATEAPLAPVLKDVPRPEREDEPAPLPRPASRSEESRPEEPRPAEPRQVEPRTQERPREPRQEAPRQEEPRREEPRSTPTTTMDWPAPTRRDLAALGEPRRYEPRSGAALTLTVPALGVYDAPVLDSNSQEALDQGLIHVPQTSMPWDEGEQKNVYLAGHRIGYPGTGSRLIFYNLNSLTAGDLVVAKDREGRSYKYRVSEVFVVGPSDSWVMGQVRGRDMITLQTCTPIPTFEKRLIVRADRV